MAPRWRSTMTGWRRGELVRSGGTHGRRRREAVRGRRSRRGRKGSIGGARSRRRLPGGGAAEAVRATAGRRRRSQASYWRRGGQRRVELRVASRKEEAEEGAWVAASGDHGKEKLGRWGRGRTRVEDGEEARGAAVEERGRVGGPAGERWRRWGSG